MGSDRRKAFRIAEGEVTDVILRGQDGDMQARLVDRSATGFQVALEGVHQIPSGSNFLLHVDGIWSQVSVVRTKRLIGETRLGLRLERELAMAGDYDEIRPHWQSSFPRVASAAISGMVLCGIVMAGLFGMAIWTGKEFILGWRFRLPELHTVPVVTEKTSWDGKKKSESRTAGRRDTAARESHGAATAFSNFESLLGVSITPPRQYQKLVTRKLEFLQLAADPRVLRELGASPEQQQRIAELFGRCRHEVQQYVSSSGEFDNRALDVIQQTHQQVRAVLSADQLKRLDALFQD